MSSLRVRCSLQEIQNLYDSGKDVSQLENLIRAFRGIQALPTTDPNSFWTLAGYHGEPFRGKGTTDENWWGGYCCHGTILFPTWHRAYLLRFENALRSVPGCGDVTLTFWDEFVNYSSKSPVDYIPSVLTSPTFELDGRNDNPLYSYELQECLVEKVEEGRYTKRKNYRTVRYPLSGLVGTKEDIKNTEIHNSQFSDPTKNATYLNTNVKNWLEGEVNIPPDPTGAPRADVCSVYSRYLHCLSAPNYTVFSNTTSQASWTEKTKQVVFSLEDAHNAIHLAVGGFYQAGKGGLDADAIPGANGDMGENDTAGFDPIVYFHHAWVDYVFWNWQVRHNQTETLEIIQGFCGTTQKEGLPDIPPGTPLDLDTPLFPFKDGETGYYTSNKVTDIRKLGYTYHDHAPLNRLTLADDPFEGHSPIKMIKRVHNINRSKIPGSFVIRTYATTPSGVKIEIGRSAILSRYNTASCKNCQNHLESESVVPLDQRMIDFLKEDGDIKDVKFSVWLQKRQSAEDSVPPPDNELPIIDDLDLGV